MKTDVKKLISRLVGRSDEVLTAAVPGTAGAEEEAELPARGLRKLPKHSILAAPCFAVYLLCYFLGVGGVAPAEKTERVSPEIRVYDGVVQSFNGSAWEDVGASSQLKASDPFASSLRTAPEDSELETAKLPARNEGVVVYVGPSSGAVTPSGGGSDTGGGTPASPSVPTPPAPSAGDGEDIVFPGG